MQAIDVLLEKNKKWAKATQEKNPEFFNILSKQQKPKYLWIGCADSRVPPNEIIGMAPGEVFVHRNIANVVVHSDLNSLSVLQYAVETLGIEQIIVCGHYDCGGVAAALEPVEHSVIDNWLHYIRDVYKAHEKEFKCLDESEKHQDLLAELNVKEQVINIATTDIVQRAWKRGQKIHIHGLIYRVKDGILNNLNVSVSSSDTVPDGSV